MSALALPCIKCGKPLKNCDSDTDNQPSGGTEFQTRGHYGSTIFDPMPNLGGEDLTLIVNICDTCILRAIDEGVIQSRSVARSRPKIVLSRHPITPEGRAWVLAQNEKHYGSAWGEDEPVDYDAKMREAGWEGDLSE
jgi:hypothetical protein